MVFCVIFDNLALVTTPLDIVSDVEPVTSPVCVALDTLAVLAITDTLLETAESKSDIVDDNCVPVWFDLDK